jgi:glycosyltransferase involved in cell wall biosynthesis
MYLPKKDNIKILMAFAFYPRGGSVQVVKYLSKALEGLGHTIKIVSGSLSGQGGRYDATRFFQDLNVVAVDYTQAVADYNKGKPTISEKLDVSISPSYEDKPSVPDKVFFKVSRREAKVLIKNWKKIFSRTAKEFTPDVIHLHHLNHIHEAILQIPSWKHIPKVAHLHGTELKMMASMQERLSESELIPFWGKKLQDAASEMDLIMTNNPNNLDEAKSLLHLKRNNLKFIPNGVDQNLFINQNLNKRQKISFLEKIFVRFPRGWDESGKEGNVKYELSDVKKFINKNGDLKPILVFAGRFLRFKRIDLLLAAIKNINQVFKAKGFKDAPFNLVVVGGFPGEYEGEHPCSVVRRLRLPNVFLSGWLNHQEMAKAFNLADIFVAPSYHEPFGQVFLEAMSVGVPVVATRSGGPVNFVVDEGSEANGWLCNVDDEVDLTKIILKALSDKIERFRRGRNALKMVTKKYSWFLIAKRVEGEYKKLLRGKQRKL